MALQLGTIGRKFDNVVDCGLFHVFSDDDRAAYVHALAQVLEPGGRIWMMCFSDKEPGDQGPRRISRQEILDAFRTGWTVESVDLTRFETSPDAVDAQFSEGGPIAHLAVIRRDA